MLSDSEVYYTKTEHAFPSDYKKNSSWIVYIPPSTPGHLRMNHAVHNSSIPSKNTSQIIYKKLVHTSKTQHNLH